MTDEDLLDNLIGLHTYDVGATDAGIHDELLRQRCMEEIDKRRDNGVFDQMMKEYFHYLTRPESEYGPEDCIEFADWLENEMNWSY